ncbi:MAG: DEAD/DEAH box helicase [Dehalococcoidia bacterium]
MNDYATFLAGKQRIAPSVGFDVPEVDLADHLFPWQRRLTTWALRKGRAALFTTTGSGKTRMQLEWARQIVARTGGPVLILAPLAVAQQTVTEGERVGVPVTLCRSGTDVSDGINITNYEMLHHFDPGTFAGVVLDESSILKTFSGVTKKRLIESFRATPYRLCCTATPAPNDVVELCNHADFLGVMKPADMITIFFISKGDDQKVGRFRLKRHARSAFFRWLASWSMSMNTPSDLGYPDDGFVLPPLSIRPRVVDTEWKPDGQLFFTVLKGITERAAVRRATVAARVQATADLVRAEPSEQWLIWCGLNDEGRAIAAELPGAVVVEGSDSPEHKADALARFASGKTQVLVTKPAIGAWGLNFQRCARMAFLGLGDSFEQYFQALRRCWRFGQTRPVEAHIVLSSIETAIFENVLRKEREHAAVMRELVQSVRDFEREELASVRRADEYTPAQVMRLPAWLMREELAHAGA